jgi:hypothetical protein
MTREQYDLRKRRLKEQLEAGIQLLESAYQAQVRALDLVWMIQAEDTGAEVARSEAALPPPPAPAAPAPAPQEPPSPPSRPRRRSPSEVSADVEEALPRLPTLFTRGDVCDALGYEPDRAVLYRILQELVQKDWIRYEERGAGQRATVYRRTGADDSPAHA